MVADVSKRASLGAVPATAAAGTLLLSKGELSAAEQTVQRAAGIPIDPSHGGLFKRSRFMAFSRKTFMLVVAVGLFLAPRWALAQETATPSQHVPLQKTIGASAADATKVEPSLIVMNADGATLADGKLTLMGIATNSIIFADRPVRAAGHALTAHLLQEWESGSEGSFAKDPPNATVSAFSKDGSTIRDAVVVLKNPVAAGDQLTFDVQVLEGDLTGADGAASVFIDIIGLPFTPLSYAGVARRTARRAAWYGAAAHPYYDPYYHPYYPPPAYYPPPRPACGYYPYPPCY